MRLETAEKLHSIKERYFDWKSRVRVSLDPNGKVYHVSGDDRVNEDDDLPRVTSITNIIDKGEGFHTYPMYQAINYIRDNLSNGVSGVDDIDELLTESLGAYKDHTNTAANYGSEAHALIEQLQREPLTTVPEEFKITIDAWENWIDSSGIVILDTETPVYYSDTSSKDAPIAFAGTVEMIGFDRHGRPVICDYKTGKSVYTTHALQLAAYSLAFSYCGIGSFIDAGSLVDVRAFVIRLPKDADGELEIKEVQHIGSQQQAFINACKLRQWQSRRDKWYRKSATRDNSPSSP